MTFYSNTVSQETIDFQRDTEFTNKLDSLHQQYVGKGTSLRTYEPLAKKVSKLLTERFGYNISIQNVDDYMLAVIPIAPAGKHILKKKGFGDYSGIPNFVEYGKDVKRSQRVLLEHLKTSSEKDTISIDLKRARVNNIPKGYKIILFMDYVNTLGLRKLTPRELSAVLMHEVGHSFTYLEEMSADTNKNTIMASVLDAKLNNDDDDKTYKYRLGDIFQDSKTKEEYMKMTKKSSSTRMWQIKTGRLILKDYKQSSMSKNRIYANSETVADVFASRFGYASELATGLDMLVKGNLKKDKRTTGDAIVSTFTKVMNFYMTSVLAALLGPVGIVITTLYNFYVLVNTVKENSEAFKDYTYEDLVDRYRIMRNEYVSLLKLTDLTKDEKESAILGLKALDGRIKSTGKSKSDLYILINSFHSASRNERNIKEFESMLEDMASNDLFIRHAELSLLK